MERKGHGTIKKSKAYGAIGTLLLSGVLIATLGAASVSADETTVTVENDTTEARHGGRPCGVRVPDDPAHDRGLRPGERAAVHLVYARYHRGVRRGVHVRLFPDGASLLRHRQRGMSKENDRFAIDKPVEIPYHVIRKRRCEKR